MVDEAFLALLGNKELKRIDKSQAGLNNRIKQAQPELNSILKRIEYKVYEKPGNIYNDCQDLSRKLHDFEGKYDKEK